MDADRSPLSFLGRRLPPAFERRVVVRLLPAAGCQHADQSSSGQRYLLRRFAVSIGANAMRDGSDEEDIMRNTSTTRETLAVLTHMKGA